MTPKKKDSPELFEIFRSAVRDRDRGMEEPEAVSDAERQALVSDAPDAPPPADLAPREAARRAPGPLAAAIRPESGLGERRLSLKYNTVVLSLMFVVGLSFVAFAMGVRWGEDRTRQVAATMPRDKDAKLAENLAPVARAPVAPAEQGPPTQATQEPSSAVPPQQPVGKWWVHLIHFDASESLSESLVQTHLKKLREKGFDKVCQRILHDSRNNRKYLAVCYGPLQTEAEAKEMLKKLVASEHRHEYDRADILCDE